ncbi:MAG: tripartite tricarboxylate transporter TctB family protein [Chloroflexi bacterium]|nr:tripartite tricarboxylate transporter TctB family protein [Chloroflexota bacterium]
MERRGGVYFLVGIMAVVSIMVIASLQEANLEAKLLPIVFGLAALILSGTILAGSLLQRRKLVRLQRCDGVGEESIATGGVRAYLVSGMWVLGFFLAIYLLGFLIAIPILVVAYTKTYGATWWAGAASAIITVVGVYAIFYQLLNVNMYGGLVLSRLLGLFLAPY